MRVFLVGEATTHRQQLLVPMSPESRQAIDVVDLPRDAAHRGDHDHQIRPEDTVISLRFSRDQKPLPPMRLLHVPGAGLDGIDIDRLAPETAVCNVFEHEIPIAEFVLASMLNWEIDLARMREGFTPNTWSDLYRARQPHGEIFGKTLGLIGFGRIGQAIGARAEAFGMHLIACDTAQAGTADNIVGLENLDRILENADYLAIACPLTEETRDMVDARALARMKPDAVLINVSRAEIVTQKALYDALLDKQIRGASLDVWYRYPSGGQDSVAPADFDFHALPNVVATPHSCAWTTQLMDRRYAQIAANIEALLAGRPLTNLVRAPRRDARTD